MTVPARPLGKSNGRLPATVPIIGLGCSSFSHFFWTEKEAANWKPENISKDDPRVQEWIRTIQYAIQEGIFLLGKFIIHQISHILKRARRMTEIIEKYLCAVMLCVLTLISHHFKLAPHRHGPVVRTRDL